MMIKTFKCYASRVTTRNTTSTQLSLCNRWVSCFKFTKAEMSDLIELIRAFGAERDVVFGDDGRLAA